MWKQKKCETFYGVLSPLKLAGEVIIMTLCQLPRNNKLYIQQKRFHQIVIHQWVDKYISKQKVAPKSQHKSDKMLLEVEQEHFQGKAKSKHLEKLQINKITFVT